MRLVEQLKAANSKLSDNYLFSGYQTKTAPFSRDDTQATTFDQFTITYNGDAGDMQFIVADNTTVTMDADGQPIFHDASPGGIKIFDAMRDLIVGLENDDTAAISTQSGLLDQGQTQIQDIRSAGYHSSGCGAAKSGACVSKHTCHRSQDHSTRAYQFS